MGPAQRSRVIIRGSTRSLATSVIRFPVRRGTSPRRLKSHFAEAASSVEQAPELFAGLPPPEALFAEGPFAGFSRLPAAEAACAPTLRLPPCSPASQSHSCS